MKLNEKQNCDKCNNKADLFHIIETKNGNYLVCEICRSIIIELVEKTCINFIQPDSSKREDLSCCERISFLEKKIKDRNNNTLPYKTLDEELLERAKMRCSELHGNMERGK